MLKEVLVKIFKSPPKNIFRVHHGNDYRSKALFLVCEIPFFAHNEPKFNPQESRVSTDLWYIIPEILENDL